MESSDEQVSNPSRTYKPFPVLLRPEGEAEGAGIIAELPSPTGILLFSALRDLMLWLLSQIGTKKILFTKNAGKRRRNSLDEYLLEDETLATTLRSLVELTERPEHFEAEEAANSCSVIADWANKHNYKETELAFVQALAIAKPKQPSHAIRTARLARDLAQFPRAETWFRHAIKLARRQREWLSYVDALRGLGSLYLRTGNFPAARAVFERGLAAARRYSFRELTGAAHHDLFRLAAEAGDLRLAYEHAKAAQEAYGLTEHFLVRLAADIAQFWITLGYAARAVPVFETILQHAPDPNLSAFWTANLTHAAALTGRRVLYESSRSSALLALPRVKNPVRLAECYERIALADLALGEWDRAAASAAEALRTATQVGAAEVFIRAEEVLKNARLRTSKPSGEPAETPGLTRVAETLASLIMEAVSNVTGERLESGSISRSRP